MTKVLQVLHLKAQRVQKDQPVQLVLKVLLDQPALPAQRVLKDQPALPVQLELKDHKEIKDHKVQRAPPALKVQQVHKVTKDR